MAVKLKKIAKLWIELAFSIPLQNDKKEEINDFENYYLLWIFNANKSRRLMRFRRIFCGDKVLKLSQ